MRRAPDHPDALAGEAAGIGRGQGILLAHREAGQRAVVGIGEIGGFDRLLGDLDAGDHRVDLAALQRRHQVVPRLGGELAGELQLLADRVGDRHVEAIEGAGGFLEAEGREFVIDGKAQGLDCLEIGQRLGLVDVPEQRHRICRRRCSCLGVCRRLLLCNGGQGRCHSDRDCQPKANEPHRKRCSQNEPSLSLERAMGIEPTTSSLGSLRSTTELRPHFQVLTLRTLFTFSTDLARVLARIFAALINHMKSPTRKHQKLEAQG